MKDKTLVVLDIDGTLLDKDYNVNSSTLPMLINKLESKGIVFCINSNRSLNDLLPVAAQFRITGPIIGENGVFIYDPVNKTTNYVLSKQQLDAVHQHKVRAEQMLVECLKALFPERKIYWESIGTADKASHPSADKYAEGSIVVLNNKFREYTVSAHLKRSIHGHLVSMSDEVRHVAKALRDFLGDQKVMEVNYSSLFANVLVLPGLTSKRKALKKLENLKFSFNHVYVIGDEISDYRMINGLGTFMTTANAELKVKAKAKYVSSASYGLGVVELLNAITKKAI